MNRVGAAVVGTTATAMVATACASTAGRSVTPPAVVSAATVYQATMSGGSAKFESTFSVTPANGKGRLLSTESGVFSWSARQGQFASRAVDPGSYDITTEQIIDGNTTYCEVSAKAARWLMI